MVGVVAPYSSPADIVFFRGTQMRLLTFMLLFQRGISKGFAAHPYKNVAWYPAVRKHKRTTQKDLLMYELFGFVVSKFSFNLKALFFLSLQGSSEAEPVL